MTLKSKRAPFWFPILTLTLSLSLFLLTSSCTSSDSIAEKRAQRAENATGEIIIGAVGPWQAESDLVLQGVAMAVAEINQAGGLLQGRRIRICAEDDQRSIDSGQIIAQQFAENLDMVAVIGHANSFISIPASIMYQYYGLVMLSPSSTSNRLTQQGYDKVFRNIPNNSMFGQSQARYCSDKGLNRLLIYHLKDDYAQDLSNAFEIAAGELGLTVVDRLSYDSFSDSRHFRNDLEYWSNTFEFDAIFLAGLMPQAARVVTEIRKQGVTVPIIASDALNTPQLFSEAGRYAQGVCTASIYHPSLQNPKNKAFVKKYIQKFGIMPGYDVAQGYDAVYVLAAAITKAQSTVPAKIADALRHLEGYEGVSGSYSFDENGDVRNRRIYTLMAEDGLFKLMDESILGKNDDHRTR